MALIAVKRAIKVIYHLNNYYGALYYVGIVALN